MVCLSLQLLHRLHVQRHRISPEGKLARAGKQALRMCVFEDQQKTGKQVLFAVAITDKPDIDNGAKEKVLGRVQSSNLEA